MQILNSAEILGCLKNLKLLIKVNSNSKTVYPSCIVLRLDINTADKKKNIQFDKCKISR